MKVTVEKELEGWWADAEDYTQLTDDEVLELIHEDVPAFLDGASWKLERADGEQFTDVIK